MDKTGTALCRAAAASACAAAGSTAKILLVADDARVLRWARRVLGARGLQLTGEAATAAEAVALARREPPDLLLVDHRVGAAAGPEVVRELRWAGVGRPAILIPPRVELTAERAAATSTRLLEPAEREEVSRARLSPREREALRLAAAGRTNPQIAAELDVGRETVKTLLGRAFRKLGARGRAHAVAVAHARRLL